MYKCISIHVFISMYVGCPKHCRTCGHNVHTYIHTHIHANIRTYKQSYLHICPCIHIYTSTCMQAAKNAFESVATMRERFEDNNKDRQ